MSHSRSRSRRNRHFLYVFELETHCGFKYNGYGHTLEEAPLNALKVSVNLKKR